MQDSILCIQSEYPGYYVIEKYSRSTEYSGVEYLHNGCQILRLHNTESLFVNDNHRALQIYREDRVYFLWKAGKALKKSRKMWPGNAILEPPKVEKNMRKAGKGIFFLWKARNRPSIPRPSIENGDLWGSTFTHKSKWRIMGMNLP